MYSLLYLSMAINLSNTLLLFLHRLSMIEMHTVNTLTKYVCSFPYLQVSYQSEHDVTWALVILIYYTFTLRPAVVCIYQVNHLALVTTVTNQTVW